MKTILCKKNQFTKVISNFGRGYPQTFNLEIKSKNGEEITGIFVEKRYLWIFPKKPIEGKLKQQMQFNRHWINGIYSVSIKPNVEVVVTRK